MTDKKKVFVAPWHVCKDKDSVCKPRFLVKDDEGCIVAVVLTREDAKRIALLPDLYDKLKEAAYEFCHNCLSLTSESEYVPDSDEFIKKGCPKNQKECFCHSWWTLLNAVRLGK